ncbi:MAG: hypothetical protein A3J51_02540 [Omnitrophica WOR_2 bacterium RIFCSPHIGHO2_02_FULL_45_21]|nr:MAG: hypothetical protein A3J51_02540 [Omnitrophica WOR_2 bacterium RIFCSPHIGHO2_02_FULL_45_21]
MSEIQKDLKGKDIIFNLKRIVISQCDSHSSSTCGGPVYFDFECDGKAGYMEDPDMAGEIKVLSVKKEKGCYLLKVKFKKDARAFDD